MEQHQRPKVTSNGARALDGLWLKALGIVFLTYAVLMTLPWQPEGFSYDLDESYKVALNQAFAEGIQFGQDFVYTYGPYGIFQQVKYFPETYSSILIGRFFIALVAGIGLWTIFIHCLKRHRASCVFLLPFLFFFPNSGISLDTFYTVIVVLPLLVYFYVEEGKLPGLSPVMLLLLSGAALAGLIKQTFLTLGIAVVLVISIDRVCRRRSPLTAIVYLACLFGFWLLAGQAPQNIGSYLINAAQIVKGFSATMGTPGAIADCFVYLLATFSFVTVAAIATHRNRRRLDLLPIAVLALVFFLAFKGAFVRHDSGHALQAVMTSIPFACLYSALLWPDLGRAFWRLRRLKVKVPLWIVTWGLLLFSAQFLFSAHAQSDYVNYYTGAVRKTGLTIEAAGASLLGKVDRLSVYQDSLAAIRAANPLPELSGTTDLYPNEAAVILAYGLPYSPRPVIQSFSAYTGHLAEINAARLAGENAPETILFDVRAIDGRLPSSEDGLSWPALLTRYDVADITGKYLVLKRSATARDYSLTPAEPQTATLGEWVDLPTEQAAATWMQIDARPGLVGRLTTTLFKLPPLFLDVELADGTVERRRVLADVLNSGQLLSPLVLDRSDFVYLAAQGWPETLKGARVRRMRLVAEGWGKWSYPSRYELTLSRFEFLPQLLAGVPGWERLSGLAALKRGETISAEGNRLESKAGPGGKLVLRSHANARVVVSLPDEAQADKAQIGETQAPFSVFGSQKLRLGYGILDEAWQEAQASDPALFEGTDSGPIADGVEFRVVALAENGMETVLFSQWLDPHVNEGDRAEKTVEIDLSNVVAKKLALETLSGPAQNSRWDWSYWSMFELAAGAGENR